MREQPELVGCGHRARGAVGRQMRLSRFHVIFCLTAPAVDILVEDTGVAAFQVRDNEARVGASGLPDAVRAMTRTDSLEISGSRTEGFCACQVLRRRGVSERLALSTRARVAF